MARKNETNADEAAGTTTETPAAASTTYFAQQRIIHEDKVIMRGAALPAGIPANSIAQLLKAGAIAATPPAPSTVTKGAAVAAPAPAKDGT